MCTFIAVILIALCGSGTEVRTLTRNGAVVDRMPVLVAGAATGNEVGPVGPGRDFGWQPQGTFPNTVFTDISFADDSVGYASAELGVVYRTTNSGHTWSRIMNLGFPYYWYGVHALSREQALVTGFNDTAGTGIYDWTFDRGASWDSIVTLDTANWFSRVRFCDSLNGIIVAGWNGGIWRTDNRGRNPGDWTYVQVDPSRAWFEGNFTFRPDFHCYLTGISFCCSPDAGQNWSVRHSADPVFDGGTSFPDTLHGWTGGGQISSPVSGWVHRTTDAGATWSDRLIETPAPVRSLLFLDDTFGFAAGGNVYSGTGFIYSTTSGGDSWNLDISTGSEMKGIDWQRASPDSIDVWCAGFNSSFTGCIYRTRIGFGASNVQQERRAGPLPAVSVSPDPARGWLDVALAAGSKSDFRLLDASGRVRRRGSLYGKTRLNLAGLDAGWYLLEAGRGRARPVVVVH